MLEKAPIFYLLIANWSDSKEPFWLIVFYRSTIVNSWTTNKKTKQNGPVQDVFTTRKVKGHIVLFLLYRSPAAAFNSVGFLKGL